MTMSTLRRIAFEVPGLPESAGLARKLLDAVLSTWGSQVDAFATALMLSELVTNALLYGVCPSRGGDCPQIGMVIAETANGLHVEVHDADQNRAQEPAVRYAAPQCMVESGRGLELVDALSVAWGTKRLESTKYVYFDVEASDDLMADGQSGEASVTRHSVSRLYEVSCISGGKRAVVSARIGALA